MVDWSIFKTPRAINCALTRCHDTKERAPGVCFGGIFLYNVVPDPDVEKSVGLFFTEDDIDNGIKYLRDRYGIFWKPGVDFEDLPRYRGNRVIYVSSAPIVSSGFSEQYEAMKKALNKAQQVRELKEELKKAGDEIDHLRIKCRTAKGAGIEETRKTLHADICDRFKMHGMELPMGLEMLEKVEDDVEWLVDEVHNLRRTEERLIVENRVLDDNVAKQKQAMDILDRERGEYQKKLIAAYAVMDANERLKKKVASFSTGLTVIDKKRKEWYKKYSCEHERAVSLDKKHKEDISKIEHLERQVEQLKIARDTNESGYLAMKNKVRQLEAEVDRLNAMIQFQSQ